MISYATAESALSEDNLILNSSVNSIIRVTYFEEQWVKYFPAVTDSILREGELTSGFVFNSQLAVFKFAREYELDLKFSTSLYKPSEKNDCFLITPADEKTLVLLFPDRLRKYLNF